LTLGYGYFLENSREIGAFFPEIFREMEAYFPEVVKMAMLQRSHIHQPRQGWCGRNAARMFINGFVQGLGTACTVKLHLLNLFQ
jgi:hypothetical protein